MKKTNKNIIITVLLISIIIVIAVQSKKVLNERTERKVITLPVSKCNPQNKICNVKHKDLTIDISLDKNIFYLKPFNVSVLSNNKVDIEHIYIDFKMKKMKMGLNRFILKNKGSQEWLGVVILPVCIAGRSDWIATVDIHTIKYRFILTFPVSIDK